MKKYFVFAIAALAALASCSKVEISAPETQSPIGFSVASYMNGTKAGALTGTTLQDPADNWQTIQAFARYTSATSQTFFGDTGVAYAYVPGDGDGKVNDWHGANATYYWPTTGTMRFAAISPAALAGATYGSTYSGADIVTLSLSNVVNATKVAEAVPAVDETPAKLAQYKTMTNQSPVYVLDQQDILYSDQTDVQNCATASVRQNDVLLTFHHALAQVVINARQKDAATAVKIQSITLKSVKVSGDLTVAYAAAATETTASWAATTDVDLKLGNISATTEGNPLPAMPANCVQVVAEALLIPSDAAVAEVVYTYWNGVETITVTQDVNLKVDRDGTENDINTWDMGHKYVYNLTIGLDEITFSASVDDWMVTEPASDAINIEA